MQRPRKTIFISAGAAAATLAVALVLFAVIRHEQTAHASPGPDLISTLPSGAPLLVYVDFSAMRSSSFYQHRPNKGPITVPNADYSKFIASTGFDFERDLDRVALDIWPPPASSPKEETKVVAIGEGRFDRAKIREYAMKSGKLEQQQGHEVFVFPATGRPGFTSFAFLDDHRIAIVSGSSIAPLFTAISPANGSGPAADGSSQERAARLDGATAFAILHVPPIPNNPGPALAQGAGAAQLIALARSVEWITLAARSEGDDMRISIEGDCDTASNAQQIKAALELMRMFGNAGLASPKTRQTMDPATLSFLQTLLTNAEVTQAAERVRILLEVTPDIFKLSGPSAASGTAQRSPRP